MDEQNAAGIFTDWQTNLCWAFIGGMITLLVSWIVHTFTKTRRRLTCKRTYCHDVNIPDGKDGTPFALLYFTIRNSGNAIVNNVRVVTEVFGNDRIIEYDWFVDKFIQCDRLDDESKNMNLQNGDTLIESTWTHLNANDEICLVVYVTPCDNPATVRFEVDATDAEITDSEMTSNCNIPKDRRL